MASIQNLASNKYFDVKQEGWDNYGYISPAGTPILIPNIAKVQFNEDGAVINFICNETKYYGVYASESQEFVGYLSENDLDILDKHFHLKTEEFLSDFNKIKYGNVSLAQVGKNIVAIAKKKYQSAYLDCIIRAYWANQKLGNSYTGVADPPFIPDNAIILNIEGTQCADYKADGVKDGVGIDIYYALINKIGDDKKRALVDFANRMSDTLRGKLFAFYGHGLEGSINHSRISGEVLKYLVNNNIYSWDLFTTQGQFPFKCNSRDNDVIFSTVDLWGDIDRDRYNANSIDWSSFNVSTITNENDLIDELERLDAISTSLKENHPKTISDKSYENIQTYIEECIEKPDIALDQKLYLLQTIKGIYAYLGCYKLYEYDFSDLVERQKLKELNSRFYEVIKGYEANHEAAPISMSNGVDQYEAQYNTMSSYFLGEQYQSMAGLMYLVYGIGQQMNATAEAVRAIKVQRMAAQIAISKNNLVNTKIELQVKNSSSFTSSSRIKSLVELEQSGSNNKRINKSQLEQRGLRLELDNELKAKMQEYRNAKTTQETGRIGEEITEIVAKKFGLQVKIVKLNGSDNGFDLIAWEGDFNTPTSIYIFESKPIIGNRIVFNVTSSKGTQMCTRWRTSTIEAMIEKTGEVKEFGNWLDANSSKISNFVVGCNKATGEIVIGKLNNTY